MRIAPCGAALGLNGRLGAGSDATIKAEARLQPAEHGLWLTAPVLAQLPFVQHVAPTREADAYLWNGQRLWRRARTGPH